MGTPIYDRIHPYILRSTSNFNENVSTCKSGFSSFCSGYRVELKKIQQFYWPRAFWPISQEPEFSQI